MKGRQQKLRLIAFRNSLGLTRIELSKLLLVVYDTWGSYENGCSEPTLTFWLKMKSGADQNNIHLDESLFYQKVKKEDKEITFTTNSLKELREKLGLSREVISKECKITSNAWGRYERGERGLLASTYFRIKDYSLGHGVELLPPPPPPIKSEGVDRIEVFEPECYVKPSLRLCLQR